MAENAIVQGIIRHVRGRGGYIVKTHGTPAGRNGIADLLLCYRGQFIALEVKQPGGRATRLQLHELTRVRRAGGITAIPTSLDQVRALLDQIDRQQDRQAA